MLLQRWCWPHRKDRLLVNCNTNNGVERQNQSFKYSYLQLHKNSPITGMLLILTEEFLLDKYERYLHLDVFILPVKSFTGRINLALILQVRLKF